MRGIGLQGRSAASAGALPLGPLCCGGPLTSGHHDTGAPARSTAGSTRAPAPLPAHLTMAPAWGSGRRVSPPLEGRVSWGRRARRGQTQPGLPHQPSEPPPQQEASPSPTHLDLLMRPCPVAAPPLTVISLIFRVFSLIHFSRRTFSVALISSLSFLISYQQGNRSSQRSRCKREDADATPLPGHPWVLGGSLSTAPAGKAGGVPLPRKQS